MTIIMKSIQPQNNEIINAINLDRLIIFSRHFEVHPLKYHYRSYYVAYKKNSYKNHQPQNNNDNVKAGQILEI